MAQTQKINLPQTRAALLFLWNHSNFSETSNQLCFFFFFLIASLKINIKNFTDFTLHSHEPLHYALSPQHWQNQACSTKHLYRLLLLECSKLSWEITCLSSMITEEDKVGCWNCAWLKLENDSHLSKMWKCVWKKCILSTCNFLIYS